jgi:hypothetical protein
MKIVLKIFVYKFNEKFDLKTKKNNSLLDLIEKYINENILVK